MHKVWAKKCKFLVGNLVGSHITVNHRGFVGVWFAAVVNLGLIEECMFALSISLLDAWPT